MCVCVWNNARVSIELIVTTVVSMLVHKLFTGLTTY